VGHAPNARNGIYGATTADKRSNGQRGASREFKEMLSYADIRKVSKDKRKHANAVRNLVENFNKFKESHFIKNGETLSN